MKKYTLSALLLGTLFSLSVVSATSLVSPVSTGVIGDVAPDEASEGCTNLMYNLTYKKSKDANTNGEVSDLQYFLQDQGLLTAEPNGSFGPATLRAVKYFQKKNGFITSGYVGPMTRAKIKEMSCNGGSDGVSIVPSIPVACTMEYRSCADGSAMPRDANCKWREDKCNVSEINTVSSSGKAVVTEGPSVALYYDSNNKESNIIAKATVRVIAGENDFVIEKPHSVWSAYAEKPRAHFFMNLQDNNGHSQAGSLLVISSSLTTLDNGDSWTVKAGKTGEFILSENLNVKQMFAGAYHAVPALYFANNSNTNNILSSKDGNYVTIVGEVSPYIVSVSPSSGENGVYVIEGLRFAGDFPRNPVYNSVTINGVTKQISSSPTKFGNNQIYFKLNDFGITKSGNYMVQVITNDGASNQFNTQINVGLTQSPQTSLSVKSMNIVGSQTTYTPGQTIKFSVSGISSDGQVASPSKGFHVQSYMREENNLSGYVTTQVNGVYQSVNAEYNYSTNMWDVTLTAPSDNTKKYDISAVFYCSASNYGCANSSVISGQTINGQITKTFNFTIEQNQITIRPITVTSPSVGETLVAGQQYTIRWSNEGLPADAIQTINIMNGTSGTVSDPNTEIITGLLSNVSSYTWTVKNNNGNWGIGMKLVDKIFAVLGVERAFAENNQYVIVINARNSSGEVAYGKSSVFTIKPATTLSPPATISASPTSCVIENGTNGCYTTLTWSSTNVSSPRVSAFANNWSNPISSNPSSSGHSYRITEGVTTFNLKNEGGTLFSSVSVTGSCKPGSAVDYTGNCNVSTINYPTVAVTLSNPTLLSSSPVSQLVIGGSNFSVATFKIASSGGSATVRELRFKTTGADAITSVTVGGVVAPVVGDSATVTGLNIPVSSTGTDVPITVKYSGFQNSTTGGSLVSGISNVKVTLNYVEAVSGAGSVITNSTPVSSNAMTLVASKPVVSVGSGNGSFMFDSENKIGEFTVSADVNGKISLVSASLNVNGVGITGFGVSSPRVANGNTTISGLSASVSGSNILITSNYPYEMTAGTSNTFSVFATVTGTAQPGMAPRILSTLTSPSSFKWKDMIGGDVQYDGTGIYNFPTNSFVTEGSLVTQNVTSCKVVDVYAKSAPGYVYSNLYIKTSNLVATSGLPVGIVGTGSWDNLTFKKDTATGDLIANQTMNSTGVSYVLSMKNNIKLVQNNETICQSINSPVATLKTSRSQVLGASTMCVDIPRNMHRGAESSSVTTLQKFLKDKGFLSEVSGFYGDKTIEAVKDYQASKGLIPTGMVYEVTRQAMRDETCQ